MSDNRRDIELRIRAQDLSTADFERVAAAVNQLTKAVTAEVDAAKKGAISVAELRSSMVQLEQAGKSLSSLAGLVDRFKDLSGVVAANEATVQRNTAALGVYRAELESSGTTSKAAETKLAGLVRQLTQSEATLERQRTALASVSEALQKSGIDTANLAAAEQQLKQVADQVGPALTKLSEAQLAYARNAREAKEAAQALRQEQAQAVAAAKLEADAINARRVANTIAAKEIQAEQRAALTAASTAFEAEQAKYTEMLNSVKRFNQQTNALGRQRAADQTQIARDAVAQIRRGNAEAEAATPGTPARPAAAGGGRTPPSSANTQAATLFGLRPYELQNLSYQINDIVSGLASGQKASQILAQQGGQVLQIFAKNLFDLVRFIPQVAIGASALILVIGGIERAFRDQAAIREFNALLTLNVDGATMSARGLVNLQKEIRDLGVSWKDSGDLIKQGIAAGIRPELLKDFADAAQNTSEVTGKKVPEAMKELIDGFTHGFDAVKKLDAEYNFLSADQYKTIQSLFDTGKGAEGAARAFAIYSEKINGAKREAVSPFTEATRSLSRAWDDLLVAFGQSSVIAGLVDGLTGLVKLIERAANGVDDLIKRYNQLPKAPYGKEAANSEFITDPNGAGVIRNPNFVGTASDGSGTVTAPVPPPSVGAGGRFSTGGLKIDTDSLKMLAAILKEASPQLPEGYSVKAISSERPGATVRRTGEPSEHGAGRALDVMIVDSSGNPVPGYMGSGGPLYDALDKAFVAAANKLAPGRPVAIGSYFTNPKDAGHFSIDGGEAERQVAKLNGSQGLQATDTEKVSKQIVDVEKLIRDLRASDATLNQGEQDRLIRERALADLKAKGYSDAAADRFADAAVAQGRIIRQRELDAVERQSQIRRVTAGAEEERVRLAGEQAVQAEIAKGNQNEADLRRVRTDAELLVRAQIAEREKIAGEERAIINQKASLDRANELKDTFSLETRLKAVADQYKAIGQNIDRFVRTAPAGSKIEGKTPEDFKKDVEASKAQAEDNQRAKFFLDKLNELQADRNALVQTYNTLLEKGTVTASEAEEKIKAAFDRTAPSIASTTAEFQKFLDSDNKLDPTKIDLYNAKIKELRANATYISPLMKSIKDAVENSFSTGLNTAFNTVSEAVGGLIAKTKSWKDVITATRDAAINFFAQLLKDIATAIIKYEALKLASSLFGGSSSSGGGGIGGFLSSVLGIGSQTGAAGATTSAATTAAAVLHGGGFSGRTSSIRSVPSSWFTNAPRYHSGRPSVGLAPDEQAAILQHGEEVLTRDNPRNLRNMGRGNGQPQDIAIRNVLVLDEGLIPGAMAGTQGERTTMAHVVKNAATIRQLVKG